MSERAFKGVFIPADVWLDERLTPLDKFVYAEISISGDNANIEEMATLFKASRTMVHASIAKLVLTKHIEYEQVKGMM